MINLKIIMEDGDYFYTKFNGTVEDAMSYYYSNEFAFERNRKEALLKVAAVVVMESSDEK